MILPWTDQQPIPGHYGTEIYSSLTKKEAAWLRANGNGKVLEIGAAFGFSTVCLGVASRTRCIVSVDPHETHASYNTFLENLKAYQLDTKVMVMAACSDEVLSYFADDTFDFAFVDGSHEPTDVATDAIECGRLVRAGGLLAFHDWGEDSCPGVKAGLEHWMARADQKMIDLVDTLAIFRVT